jgi:hypothetical protein
MTGLVDPALEAWTFASSLVFLFGIALVVAYAVPVVRARYPKVLFVGFALTIASFALVGLGALLLG